MDFLKKNYEKIILGVVLIGLTVAVTFMLFEIASEKAKLEHNVRPPRLSKLPDLDMESAKQAIGRLATPIVIDFSAPNKLFNPMAWQKKADGTLVPGESVGPTALTVTKLTPLYLKLTFDSVTVLDTNNCKYVIGVEKQITGRLRKATYCTPGVKYDTFTLLEAKGKPEDPSELLVTLNDTGERGVITKDKPFQRVEGYMADLRYDLEKRVWTNRRVNSKLNFNGEDYIIVAINQDEVIISAPNLKKWTIKYNPANSASETPQK